MCVFRHLPQLTDFKQRRTWFADRNSKSGFSGFVYVFTRSSLKSAGVEVWSVLRFQRASSSFPKIEH